MPQTSLGLLGIARCFAPVEAISPIETGTRQDRQRHGRDQANPHTDRAGLAVGLALDPARGPRRVLRGRLAGSSGKIGDGKREEEGEGRRGLGAGVRARSTTPPPLAARDRPPSRGPRQSGSNKRRTGSPIRLFTSTLQVRQLVKAIVGGMPCLGCRNIVGCMDQRLGMREIIIQHPVEQLCTSALEVRYAIGSNKATGTA